ncbi:MAG: PAS domain-containing protein [Cyclobacteriaceae bacterium]|nr:PAS domain-containing protein [Cyclobacteriaceae bacterium SS2]
MNYLQDELQDLIRFDDSVLEFIRDAPLDGLYYWDLVNPVNDWIDGKLSQSLGFRHKKITDVPTIWRDIIYPEDRKVLESTLDKHLKDDEYPIDMVIRYRHQNGSLVWFSYYGKLIKEESGKPVGVLGVHIDITKFIERENELSIAEEQFRGAFEHSALGMALVSTEGKWLKVNKKICNIVGYSEKELLAKTFQDITHPEDLDADLNQVKQLLDDKIAGYEMEKRYFHKDGHIIWVLLNVSLVRDVNRNPVHFVSQILDITERKRTEEELRQVTDRLALALKGSKIGTWEFDVVNNVLIWDEAMFKIYGVPTDKFTHAYDAWKNTLHPDDLDQAELEVQLAIAGEKEFNTEFRVIWPDNSIHYIKGLALVQRDHKGNPIRMLGTNFDITEEKKLEETQRMMAANESKRKEMEQFAYITSHDLREPLVTIQRYLGGFLEDYGQAIDDDARHYIEASVRASNHMQELIVGLLDYSRLSKEKEIKVVDSNEVLNSVIEDLNALIDSTDAVITAENLPVLKAYPLELKLLFQNLIQNGIKFRRKETIPRIQIQAKQIAGGWQFSFADNGIGIREKDFEKVFTLFRRLHNKSEYEGSGIGLAYVKKIVEIHHGKIWLESSPGKGSTFYFSVLTESL